MRSASYADSTLQELNVDSVSFWKQQRRGRQRAWRWASSGVGVVSLFLMPSDSKRDNRCIIGQCFVHIDWQLLQDWITVSSYKFRIPGMLQIPGMVMVVFLFGGGCYGRSGDSDICRLVTRSLVRR